MAPPIIPSPPPPPLPVKTSPRRPAPPKSVRTPSNSSIPTLATTSRLARHPSASSSSNATLVQQSPSPARRPMRSTICPSSSRAPLSIPALDPSQDHHRSDSGRSTGSSRSTATTDSFFLPQHPHVLNRRFKDLPAPPSSSALADAAKQPRTADAPPLGLNIALGSSAAAAAASLPAAHLYRSQSSVSTTPTSPEEGSGSSLGEAAPADFPALDDDALERKTNLKSDQVDPLDDFWQSDYSYARPSLDQARTSLPPLMRSNAPIPPSRSQSLDPFAAPLDMPSAADGAHMSSDDDHTLQKQTPTIGPVTPLVAANLQKLNSQNTSSPPAAPTLTSPVLSSLGGAPTPTKRSDDGRLAAPRASSYKPTLTSTSSDSSVLDHRSQPNKSSSSLSTSSAHENEKATLATASKRSSTSSSSSFRMTLSRQAKTLRNSFMWTPPINAQSQFKGQERVTAASSNPISQASSPSLASPPTPSPPVETPLPAASASGVARAQHAKPASSDKTSKPNSLRSSRNSVDLQSKQSGTRSRRSDAKMDSAAPVPSTAHSFKPKPPTDYAKLEERPKFRLSSRLTLQNTNWSMKISNLKTKKPADATTSTSTAPTSTSEPNSRAPSRRSKSQASLSSAGTVAPAGTVRAGTRDTGKRASVVQVSERPGSITIGSTPLLTSGRSSTEAQLSPSFAQTFAFLKSQIDSPSQSPPLLATALPALKEAQISALNADLNAEKEVRSPRVVEADPAERGYRAAEEPKTNVARDAVPVPTPQLAQSPTVDGDDAASQAALFDRLADSPEAVYKTLVLPEPKVMPTSQSLGNVSAATGSTSKQLGHKKHISLGSANLISRSARRAAADLDKRANATPVVNGHVSTRSSFSGALPVFTPVDEENPFFDALTSPLNEHPSHAPASPSADDSMLPTFATATEFFPLTAPTSPVRDRSLASQSTANIVAMTPSAAHDLPQPNRTSLGRRLSGVFGTSKARSARKNMVASPPQSPQIESTPLDALPARAETSLGFYLRNPLRRERKASLKTAAPQSTLSQSRFDTSSTASSSSSKAPASALRKMSSGFKLDRASPADRAETSLGLAPPAIKVGQGFSSSVLAPTKSSLARSVQPSPPSAGAAGRSTVRSASTSSLGTPTSNSLSRSPQRPANPPSSFRRSSAASSRPSVVADGSPTKGSTARTNPFTKAPLSMAKDVASAATSQTGQGAEVGAMPAPSDVRRRRTLSKPVLHPIRTAFADEPRIARPSTAMGFRGGMATKDRKMSQPTLDMVDDREFLAALEQVRAVQRERIEAQAQELENKTRLARLGMMSGNHLKTKVSGSMLDDDDLGQPATDGWSSTTSTAAKAVQEEASATGPVPGAAAKSRLRHRRSASADSKLGRTQSMSPTFRETEREVDQLQKDIVKAYADKKSPVGPPTSGLEWGVGKASGKLHDGTFVNDDDWKKEVKALFLIRELVQTERSYARHLSSLFAVIIKMPGVAGGSTSGPGSGIKRKSTSNLFAAYSSAYASKTSAQAGPPSHVGLLRTYLPQLIALSNSLVQRVEENPTSAGVGAAFDVLSAQLESTFVGWSAVASEALKEMRATELAKAKSPYKIGLVPLMPRESTEVGASTAEASSSSGSSSPASGLRSTALRMTSLTRPASPVAVDAGPASQADGGATLPAKRSAKRRSTITSTSFIPPPRIVVAPAAKLSSSPEQEMAATEAGSTVATTPSRRFGHSRSQSTFVTPTPTPTSAVGPEAWPGLSMTPSATTSLAPASQPQQQQRGGKSLTPMDIAIMPTQRLPRYGLMLRDLLRNTPPESLSHARVQRAVALIQRVALLCDSAAPVPTVKTAPSSGAATPLRAGSVLGMTSGEVLGAQASPLLSAAAFGLGKRG
ncbi:conserved hypothetical protein [Sporisorium reilianum SRZ2]|uniref:DH domain-containing protein n=1 Tax=Sporisorium reilianum (strain SRZ2) TaxID=999809 RepID=E7A1B9_SPORE|nr:conserved hypothetical protein [Sporisorium reilianum SRZ2]